MKKYLIYGFYIFAGIALVIGLRGASAANQTDTPSSSVTPTFSGLTVKGAVNIDDEFYTGSDIGGITPTKGYWTILDRLITHGVSSFLGTATFQNDVDIKGGLTIGGSAKATGKLSTDSNLTVGGAFEAKGKALFGGDTEIKNAYITGSLQNSAADGDFVKIDDQLDVRKGIFNNDGTKLIKFGSGSSPMDLSVTGKSTVKDLNISVNGKISYDGANIISFSKGSLANGVEISGNLKAKNIGAYNSPTASKSLPKLKTDSVVTYCGSSNDKLLSCTFWTPGFLTISSLERIKKTNTDKTETWGCSLAAYNPTNTAYNMSVTAFCHNSNSF